MFGCNNAGGGGGSGGGSGGSGNFSAFGDGEFLTDRFGSSTDGITWTEGRGPAGGQLAALAYGPMGWVGVGYSESFWTRP